MKSLNKRHLLTLVTLLTIPFISACGKKEEVVMVSTDTPPAMNIHEAVLQNNLEAIQLHIKAGSDLDEKEPLLGSTPLIIASTLGHEKIAEALINNGAGLNVQNNDQSTALLSATFFAHPEIVKLLLDAGADPAITDKNGVRASELAATEWNPELEGAYQLVFGILQMELDLDRIKKDREEIAKIFEEVQ